MDKVKVALALLKKHHFWVMTVVVILCGLTGWFMATSQLWAEYQASRAKILGKFDDMNKIRSEEQKNDDWIKGIEDETTQLKAKVALAWKKVYTEQRDYVLKWPKVLGEQNIAILQTLAPTAEIPIDTREDYLNYIHNEFPRLLDIVKAQDLRKAKTLAAATNPKQSREEAAAAEQVYKVIWDSKNQEAISQQLDWQVTPTSHEVREVQENLWVYESLLNIVNNLNDLATGNYNARVKEIRSLSIGKEAASKFQAGMAEGWIDHPDSAAGGVSATTTTGTETEGRYVDDKGKPLTATDAAAGGASEFKRMPVCLELVMDQREISRLLIECANSPLPVEVRQFRVHPKKKDTAGAQTRSRTGGSGSNSSGGEEKDQGLYDVLVEVQGIIYIFNPPDVTKLGPVAVADSAAPSPAQAANGVPAGGQPPVGGNAAPPPEEKAQPDSDRKVEAVAEPATAEPADPEDPAAMSDEPPAAK
jgi:hypothetical protein